MGEVVLDRVTVTIPTRERLRRSVVRVLDEVSLTVAPGTVTALVGESGCGKSMVASAICGLLPPGASSSGSLTVDDTTLTDLTGRDRRWNALRGHRIGLVPQSAATSFTPVRTIGGQLNEAIRTLDGPLGAGELCAMVQLDPAVLDCYPHELSGGMAQRAAIAAALAGDPDVIVADEPTSALDPALGSAIWDLLRASAHRGAAVLVITHDVGVLALRDVPPQAPGLLRGRGGGVASHAPGLLEASPACDAIAVMRAGRIVEYGAAVDVLESTDPYVAGFFETVA